jgi:hypothetical protein
LNGVDEIKKAIVDRFQRKFSTRGTRINSVDKDELVWDFLEKRSS